MKSIAQAFHDALLADPSCADDLIAGLTIEALTETAATRIREALAVTVGERFQVVAAFDESESDDQAIIFRGKEGRAAYVAQSGGDAGGDTCNTTLLLLSMPLVPEVKWSEGSAPAAALLRGGSVTHRFWCRDPSPAVATSRFRRLL